MNNKYLKRSRIAEAKIRETTLGNRVAMKQFYKFRN